MLKEFMDRKKDKMNNYIIIHGSFGSSEGNWFPWLKMKLEEILKYL
jgi:predicted alpha/beta hydrolase family esterase